jgi:hypothetical protein
LPFAAAGGGARGRALPSLLLSSAEAELAFVTEQGRWRHGHTASSTQHRMHHSSGHSRGLNVGQFRRALQWLASKRPTSSATCRSPEGDNNDNDVVATLLHNFQPGRTEEKEGRRTLTLEPEPEPEPELELELEPELEPEPESIAESGGGGGGRVGAEVTAGAPTPLVIDDDDAELERRALAAIERRMAELRSRCLWPRTASSALLLSGGAPRPTADEEERRRITERRRRHCHSPGRNGAERASSHLHGTR